LERYLQYGADKTFPTQTRRLRPNHKHWVTPDIIKTMHLRDVTRHKAHATNDQDLFNKYKKLRNKVNKDIRLSQKSSMEHLVITRRKNPTKFWKDVTSLMPSKINMASIPKKLSLDEINKYFATIGGKTISDPASRKNMEGMPWKGEKSMHDFTIQPCTVELVEKQLNKLPDKPNIDILGLDCKLLRATANIIAPSLTTIFNLSIKTGIVPQEWKLNKVTPAYKGKGDREDPGNYRPISVMSHTAKIMERIIGDQFIHYLTKHKFLTPDQSAYLAGNSTQTSLHRLVDDILEDANEGDVTAACFLDISKCFDSICHDYLLQKLENYGIRQNLNWFTSYLSNRMQQVYHNGTLSSPEVVLTGVPQGSVLGPFLFILFANDLGNYVQEGLVNCYSDDTVVYTTGKTADEAKSKLQRCLVGVEHWYTENKLKVNVTKSMTMLFGTKQRLNKNNNTQTKVFFGNQELEETQVYKYLGLLMDPTLSWNAHCNSVVSRGVYKLHLMRRLRRFLPRDTLVQIYKTYMMPIVEYGATVWGYTSKANIGKMDKIIKTSARIICNNYNWDVSGATLAKQLLFNSFEERRDYLLAVLTYKALNNLGPDQMADKLTSASLLANRCTRQTTEGKLHQPRPNLNIYKSSYTYRAPLIWNKLDDTLKEAPSVNAFKVGYKVQVLGLPPKHKPKQLTDD
jgi:hypothetical protein